MSDTIAWRDLIRRAAKANNVPINDMTEMADALFAEIEQQLLSKKSVRTPFGRFELIQVEAEIRRNTVTRTVEQHHPGYKLTFMPGKRLKDQLRPPKTEIEDPDAYYQVLASHDRTPK